MTVAQLIAALQDFPPDLLIARKDHDRDGDNYWESLDGLVMVTRRRAYVGDKHLEAAVKTGPGFVGIE